MTDLSLPTNLKEIYHQWKRLLDVHELCSERKWLDCISLAGELTSDQENDFFGYYYKGLCYTECKLFEEAISNFESALVNLKRNRFPKLMEEYEQDTELRITHSYRLQRKYSIALERLDELILNHPKYLPAYKSKASIQVDIVELKNALDTANQGLVQHPNDIELKNLRNSLVYELTTNK